jgi:molybdopterin-binding protein
VTPTSVSLSAEGIKRRFGRNGFALQVDRVDVPAGETLVLLGPSGSGKTTLLEVLGLLHRPDAGTVLLDGKPVTMRDRAARLQMAAVFQRPYLFKGSVAENVGYGLAARGVPRRERRARVSGALARVGLAGFEDRSAVVLSGGEAQRVSLARALVLEPRILLLDEPLASLDRLLKRQLTHDFATILSEAGVTVVYVTHDQDEALVVGSRIAVMNEGRIVASGPADEVMGLAVDEWSACFLGVEPAARGRVTAVDQGLISVSGDGLEVFASGNPAVGSELFFSVHPEDVLLFESDVELPLTTARNRVPVTVSSVEPRGATFYATLDAGGVRLAASVSRAAASELGVVPGATLLAVFKATAVRWRLVNETSSAATM